MDATDFGRPSLHRGCSGTSIPLPGIDYVALANSDDVDVPSVLALGIQPILSAFLIVEICRLVILPLGRWSTATTYGRRTAATCLIVISLAFATIQAMSIQSSLQSLAISGHGFSNLLNVSTLVAGTAILATIATSGVIPTLAHSGFFLTLSIFVIIRFVDEVSVYVELIEYGAIPVYDFLAPAAVLVAAFTLAFVAARSTMAMAELSRGSTANWRFLLVVPPFIAGSLTGAFTLLLQAAGLVPDTPWPISGFMIAYSIILSLVLPATMFLSARQIEQLAKSKLKRAWNGWTLAWLSLSQVMICVAILFTSAFYATMVSGPEIIALASVCWALAQMFRRPMFHPAAL